MTFRCAEDEPRETTELVELRARVLTVIADRLEDWRFPAGSDALGPMSLLVAELRRDVRSATGVRGADINKSQTASLKRDPENMALDAPDLDAISAKWLAPCGACDAGLPMGCTHPREDYRPLMLSLVLEIERLRGAVFP